MMGETKPWVTDTGGVSACAIGGPSGALGEGQRESLYEGYAKDCSVFTCSLNCKYTKLMLPSRLVPHLENCCHEGQAGSGC